MQRNRTSALWRTISLTALISTLLLLFGFGYSVRDMLWPKEENYAGEKVTPNLPEQTSLGASKEIRITAIGDSLTKGTGDATGEGYVKQIITFAAAEIPEYPCQVK